MSEEFIYSGKNNFAGGELTPTIEGRTELGLYQNGVRNLVNFMILPSGGIMRRPGTEFVYLFNDSSSTSSNSIDGCIQRKMVNVMFSRDLSYLLVFESDNLKTTCSFFVGGELFVNKITLKHNDRDFHFKSKDFSYCCYQGMAYISFGARLPIYVFSVDIEIVDEFYQYIKQRARERQESGDRPEIAIEEEFRDAASFTRRDEMFIIKPFSSHVKYFKHNEDNRERPFNEVIELAEIDQINDELRALHSDVDSNIYEHEEKELYANHVVTFENRLWCFGVNNNIHGIWASSKGDFTDFSMAYRSLLEARNPMSAFSSTFSSSTFDNVLWTIPFSNELLIGTTDGIYLAKEGNRASGEFLKIHKEIDIPVSPIRPVIIAKSVFFVEGDNCKINSLYYSREKGGYQISSITHFAEHIFSCGISQLAGSNTPFSLLFAVLKNGSFASFTYLEDLKIMGWAQHWLGGSNAHVLSITPIHASGEDRLYFHVRRSDAIGVGVKEYLEVLHTKYFTAKIFEIGKAVYADCHVNIKRPGEHVFYNNIVNAIADDTAYEFRGSITKLEEIIHQSAGAIAKLNIDNIDIGRSFKYNGILIGEYIDTDGQEISDFLVRYYSDYQPKIMELLAISFAFYRLMGKAYASLESIFSSSERIPARQEDDLPELKKILYEAERLAGDIIHLTQGDIQNWQIPDILLEDAARNIEYINNDGFSFNPTICQSLKDLDTQIVRKIFDNASRVAKIIEEQTELSEVKSYELLEMLRSVAVLNKKMLEYYAGRDNDNRGSLDINIRKFFQSDVIGFYSKLKDISHSTLTRYLYSNYMREWLKGRADFITDGTGTGLLVEQTREIVSDLIDKLEEKHADDRVDEIASFKRVSEIREVIISSFLDQDLNDELKDYVASKDFEELINDIISNYEFGLSSSTQSASTATSLEASSNSNSDSSDSNSSTESEDSEQLDYANIVSNYMTDITDSLTMLKSHLLSYCQLIIINQDKHILKTIIEDEKNIKLEKYLLLSKKYYPLFRKMFPDIGSYEMSVIARSCMNSFRRLNLGSILPIYQKMQVSIIGDEELQEVRLLENSSILLKQPARFLSIGFSYRSLVRTFPFIYPDEYEHLPKYGTKLGVKLFNTKGGYMEEKLENGEIDRQHVYSKYIDRDSLTRYKGKKQYLRSKSISDLIATPYLSGWVNFTSKGEVKLDNDFTFIIDKPYPASILKIYAKAKILRHCNG